MISTCQVLLQSEFIICEQLLNKTLRVLRLLRHCMGTVDLRGLIIRAFKGAEIFRGRKD